MNKGSKHFRSPCNQVMGDFSFCGRGLRDKPGRLEDSRQQPKDQNDIRRDQDQNHKTLPVPMLENNVDSDGKIDNKIIDLNTRPHSLHGQNSSNQGLDVISGSNH